MKNQEMNVLFIHLDPSKIEPYAGFDPDLFTDAIRASCLVIWKSAIKTVYLPKGSYR
ncbi:hypothetical protein OYT88_15620 [Sporolactobacillus sp. CQH2019]|uniref:hypothetical protein n=1 Tax=Sporolactobacillus sp. CQH2019 TaxID=3023512 RepID=UPI002367590F|nr:hypothetical protein [Sporolactobacillus sp. CQH2019]MDD9149980.1 hypothetical protein [Sporolactobacillus sp. CQH2019]